MRFRGVPARVHGSLSRRPRAGLRVLRGRAASDRLRQHEDRGGEDRRQSAAGGDPRVPAADEPLPVRLSFLPGASTEREGSRRASGGVHAVELPGAGAAGGVAGGTEHAIGGAVPAGSGADDAWEAGHGGDSPGGGSSGVLPIPAKRFEARRVAEVSANSLSLVRFDTNSYSVPMKYAHRTVPAPGVRTRTDRTGTQDRRVTPHPDQAVNMPSLPRR